MARTIFHSFAAPTREIFFLPLEHKFIYPYCCLISSTYGFCYRVILESSSICPIILAQKISSLNVYGQKILSFRGNVQFYEGPQKGSSIPTKLFSQSRNPDGLYRPIPIPIIQFCLIPFPKLRRAFPWVMIFLTSIDPLKSIVTVRREFISFHQNDDIVHFRSFQSFARITYASHGNDVH